MSHVTVIGAGIIGINCAIELRKAGHEVVVLDRAAPGDGCSYGNAGILAASAFEPLAKRDTLLKIPGWLLDPKGPLSIRWRYLPRLTPWLLKYAKAGMFGDFNAACEALYPLMEPCVGLYARLMKEAGSPDLIQRHGGLYVYESYRQFKHDMPAHRRRLDRGFRSRVIGAVEIRERAEGLAPSYRWGYLVDDIGHVMNPKRVVDVLASYACSLGVCVEQVNVHDIRPGPNGPEALVTDRGVYPVEKLVIAAGAYSHYLCEKIGDHVPLDTERGYHVMIKNPGPVPRLPVMDATLKAWITPMEHGLRCAGTVELASVNAPENYQRAGMLLQLAKRMVPSLNAEEYDVWMGRRPTLPDSIPVIGPATKIPNVYYAFGHHHLGLTGAPATAKLIAGLVSGREPNRDISAYRADRF